MDDKKVRKVLSKMRINGSYKQVYTYEECDKLLTINHKIPGKSAFYRKQGFTKEELLNDLPDGFTVAYLKKFHEL